ncbi:AbrB/MazE/SpoVT family DNA-binding domain-containing protein [Candidatus Bathyarchaeota archaeon]|nr:MAG: AbrB/MazE/SpoVT family DNA-binding domain-containing protein [Candidatus Bathyarchaeota archaeon]
MMEMVIKSIDRQGRLVIPKKWREKVLGGDKVILVLKDDLIELRPYKGVDLTAYFDSIEVELKSDLSDWHSVRKELRAQKGG